MAPHAPHEAAQLAAAVAEDIIAFDNTLCARDALTHATARALMTPAHIASLDSLIARAHLNAGTIPTPLGDRLDQILDAAERALALALDANPRTGRGRQ